MGEIIKSAQKIKEVMNEMLTDTAHSVSSIISGDSILPAEVDNFDMNSIIAHVQEDYSDDVQQGIVIEQSVAEGEEVFAGTKITVKVTAKGDYTYNSLNKTVKFKIRVK